MPEFFTQSIDAGLMKVLAEAASGYPNQGIVYFVARCVPEPEKGYDVTAQKTAKDAEDLAIAKEVAGLGTYAAFGPFDTTLPYPTKVDQADVTGMQLQAAKPDGTVVKVPPLGGCTTIDALFISPAAVLKFAVPYYTAVYSPEFAEQMLLEYLDAPLAVLAHLPWSEYEPVAPEAGAADAPTGALAYVPAVFEEDGEGGYRTRAIRPLTPPRPLLSAWPM